MTAKVYRLEDYRLRRYPTSASQNAHKEPGSALGTALRAVAESRSQDFKVKAGVFQRAFREAIERTNAQLRSQADGCADDGDGEL